MLKTPLIIEQHIHGAFGVDFNTAGVQDVIYLADKLLEHGIGGFFPTLVTDSFDNIKKQINVIKEAAKVYPKYYNDDVLKLFLTNINVHYKGLEISERLTYVRDVINNYKKHKVKEVAKVLATYKVKSSYKKSMDLIEKYINKTNDYLHAGTILLACGNMNSLAYILKNYHNNREVGEFICEVGEKVATNHYNQCIYIFNQAMFMYETGEKKTMKKAVSLVEDIVKFESKNRVDRSFTAAKTWLEKGYVYDYLLKKVKKVDI